MIDGQTDWCFQMYYLPAIWTITMFVDNNDNNVMFSKDYLIYTLGLRSVSKTLQHTIFWLPWQHMVTMKTGPVRCFPHRTLTSPKSGFMIFHGISGPWECFFGYHGNRCHGNHNLGIFRPFGPKAHLHAKFREDRVVNNRDNWRPTFALYIYYET